MARFKYVGEPARPGLVERYGDCSLIRVPTKEGKMVEVRPPGGKEFFTVGEDIGVDVENSRTLRSMRADPRFEEITGTELASLSAAEGSIK
jgi:hypothetical protein